jgi:Asp-tRNA(Asn)/Glu-tRNA(Gln) amidotransferase A subunit family amidase
MHPPRDSRDMLDRRRVLSAIAGLGIGTTVFHRALASEVAIGGGISVEMIQQAEWVAGLELTDEERAETLREIERANRKLNELRNVQVDYDVAPALQFYAAPTSRTEIHTLRRAVDLTENAASKKPASDEDVAFLPVTELAALIRTKQISSIELTELYLERLRKYNEVLNCVVTLTEETALKQARRADRELAAGRYRGPLHGIPWGAKDLIAYPGYPTGWGAVPFKDQVFEKKATVAKRLDEAGAVLVAKLSLGALAWGDQWYGGLTRNPWNPKQGSSGSSAGSASATAAGLVGFSLGSETLGSIVSPCRRCGTTGLRPTFGRVSRYGCMPLAWSMDKIGPITRSVEDCAVVFAAIHGYDGLDATAIDRDFAWPPRKDIRKLRVGYVENSTPSEKREELNVLRDLGVKLVPISLPKKYPVWPLTIILNTEAASVFDTLTREKVNEGIGRWPNSFRQGQFVPAVEYLRANRIRTMLMREMESLMAEVDAYVAADDLALTNLTGHPTVVFPSGFNTKGDVKTPYSLTMTGRLFEDADLLSIAHAYQQATTFHLERPPLDRWLKETSPE